MEKSRSKKKFLVNVTDDKGNSENHSPNMSAARAAFGKKRSSNFTSQRAESKDSQNYTDEEFSIAYEECSPRYEAKDSQHENLLRIAHQLSPTTEASPSNSVKGPPAELISPLSQKRGSFDQLVGSPTLNVAKREVELSPKTPDSSTVSPSHQVTPPSEDDMSDTKTNITSKEEKSDASTLYEEYDQNLYTNSGEYDENYYYHENNPHSEYDFQIVNQEYYTDTNDEVSEAKLMDEDLCRNNISLKALTPVKMKASVTVITESLSEDKSVVDSPESSSSKVTSLSTELEVEQLFSKVRHNRIEDVRMLLEQGASVGLKDANGNSLLHICAQNNLKRMASLVLDHGADINSENKKGLTALDYCDNYHFDKLGDWFVKHGADNGILNMKY
jgi:hypothetical protein